MDLGRKFTVYEKILDIDDFIAIQNYFPCVKRLTTLIPGSELYCKNRNIQLSFHYYVREKEIAGANFTKKGFKEISMLFTMLISLL
jgi:hypothetical protein